MNYYGFIYEWTNTVSGKKYIGSHMGDINDGYVGSGKIFLQAIKKYGINNFTRIILEQITIKDRKFLLEREKFWLDKTNAAFNRNYYNVARDVIGGDTHAGWSEERKQMFSKQIKEVWANRTLEEKNKILSKTRKAQEEKHGGKEQLKIWKSEQMKANRQNFRKLSTEEKKEAAKKALITLGKDGIQKRAEKSKNNRNPKKVKEGIKRGQEKRKTTIENRTLERKQKIFYIMSEAKKGKCLGDLNPNAKKVEVNGTIFSTFNAAKVALNMTEGVLRRRLNSKDFPEWKYIKE